MDCFLISYSKDTPNWKIMSILPQHSYRIVTTCIVSFIIMSMEAKGMMDGNKKQKQHFTLIFIIYKHRNIYYISLAIYMHKLGCLYINKKYFMKNNDLYKQCLKAKTFISTTSCNLNATNLRYQKRNMPSLLKGPGSKI